MIYSEIWTSTEFKRGDENEQRNAEIAQSNQ